MCFTELLLHFTILFAEIIAQSAVALVAQHHTRNLAVCLRNHSARAFLTTIYTLGLSRLIDPFVPQDVPNAAAYQTVDSVAALGADLGEASVVPPTTWQLHTRGAKVSKHATVSSLLRRVYFYS